MNRAGKVLKAAPSLCGQDGAMIVDRYAPSPTSDLHLGNLRTALAGWLLARSAGGRWLMRVEDRGISPQDYRALILDRIAGFKAAIAARPVPPAVAG